MKRSIKLLLISAFTLALAPGVASASDSTPSEAQAQRALERAKALFGAAPETAAAPEQATHGGRDATLVLRDLAVALPALEAGDRRAALQFLGRPTDRDDRRYFGREAMKSPICDPHFCVHWAAEGVDAPRQTDDDGDGIPDFAEEVLRAAGDSYSVENRDLRWRDAVSDGRLGERRGEGVRGEVDVYLAQLGTRLFGFAAPDPRQHGAVRHAYLVLDDDFVGFGGEPVELMEVTLAHEYNHVLQFGYDTFQDVWMFEATATWVENQVFPAVDDYLNFIPPFARGPRLPLNSQRKMYGSSVWNHWLTSVRGAETIRRAWQISRRRIEPPHSSFTAYDDAIEALGGRSIGRDFASFAAATAEWKSSRLFPDSKRYPDMKRNGKLGQRAKGELDHMAYQLLSVKNASGAKLRIRAKVEPGTRSAVSLIARDGTKKSGRVRVATDYMRKGGRTHFALRKPKRFERITVVVANADERQSGTEQSFRSDDANFKLRRG